MSARPREGADVSARPRAGLRRSLLALAAVVGLVAAIVARAERVPRALTADAPPTAFSAERALQHAPALVSVPHPSGSAAHAQVRAYLLAQFQALGLVPHVQVVTAVGTRYPVAGRVMNVLARIPGRTTNGKAVLLAAHYDGVWASPAAADDGHGVMALLEAARALRAAPPLAHDVIVLVTDAEEAGLLGAAAFVAEHPWAKDVAVVVNVEARGTEGRAFMFETGRGNLDVVRVLRGVPDVTSNSLTTTIYRRLPNDTDLSEFSRLGTPALNFAFVDGVERYHTAHDDLAHLSRGSLQHAGAQMLALARAFGDGPLPRPVTGDAVFFDLPFMGLVAYPESWAVPLAGLAAALALLVLVGTVRRASRAGPRRRVAAGIALGVVLPLVAAVAAAWAVPTVASLVARVHEGRAWGGAPAWRPEYAAALTLLAAAITIGAWAIGRRWADEDALAAGAMLPWAGLAVLAAVALPGASWVTTWPTLVMAGARFVPGRQAGPARWAGVALAMTIVVPLLHGVAGLTLPLDTLGGVALGALVPLSAWLCAPALSAIAGDRPGRATLATVGAAAVAGALALGTVRADAAHPATATLEYLASAGRDSAWLTTRGDALRPGSFAARALGDRRRALPSRGDTTFAGAWLHDAGREAPASVVSFPNTEAAWPDAMVLADATRDGMRRVTLRLTAPPGTLALRVGSADRVRVVSVDGRTLDTTRYRRRPRRLALPLVAPPDSGFVVALELADSGRAALDLSAVSSGLPRITGFTMPSRRAEEVPIQNGDVTVRHRRVVLPLAPRIGSPRATGYVPPSR